MPAQPVDATLSDLEIPYKQVVLSLRTNLASPLQRKRLIFCPFKGPGCQFNTLEKCSVLKFLQAGFARVLRRPIETADLTGKVGTSVPSRKFLANVRKALSLKPLSLRHQILRSYLRDTTLESTCPVTLPCLRS